MQSTLLRFLFITGTAATVAACSSGAAPSVPTAPIPPVSSNNGTPLLVGPYTGTFTEYNLPGAQSAPGDITVGPDGAVWFTVNTGIDRLTGGGTITSFPVPSNVIVPAAPAPGVYPGIASASGALWYGMSGIFPDDPSNADQHLIRQPISGAPTVGPLLAVDAVFQHLRAAPDGVTLWAGAISGDFGIVQHCSPVGCGETDLGAELFPGDVAVASDGDAYVTVMGLIPHDSLVLAISPSAGVLHQFTLPDGTNPMGITFGPDGALWITLEGSNSIGRLTTSGAFTQFPLPTPNANPFEIIKGTDGALWFTENAGNKIGRITTSGAITEYTVPTPNAHPSGITTCPQQCENAHERIWFTETQAGKVGEFVF